MDSCLATMNSSFTCWIHMLEDGFTKVAMNSLAVILNSCNDPWIHLVLYEFLVIWYGFIGTEQGILSLKAWIPPYWGVHCNQAWFHSKWQGIHITGMSFCISAVNSKTVLENSHFAGWIRNFWEMKFILRHEFILRRMRIHLPEDEFIDVGMNSLTAMLNSPRGLINSCSKRWIPSLLCEFVWIEPGILTRSLRIPKIAMNSRWPSRNSP
jgi:hypothetical protein